MGKSKEYYLLYKRKDLKLSICNVSEQTGINKSTISRIERLLNKPRMETLKKICDVYKIDFEETLDLVDVCDYTEAGKEYYK